MVRAKNKAPEASTLALEEYFAQGDERFLSELYAFTSRARALGNLAARWVPDARPFARAALLAYVDDGCDRPHHRQLVKKLFKLAEERRDDELLAHFTVSFDRLFRRVLRTRRHYDYATRAVQSFKYLAVEKGLPGSTTVADYMGRFTTTTRRYLQRRATRYFRTMGRTDPARFRTAAALTLGLYRDEHLDEPHKLLGHWALVHFLYRGSPVLLRPVTGIKLAPGASLADLRYAPMHESVWTKGSLEELLALAADGGSAPVRNWALSTLREHYLEALRVLPMGRMLALLRSPHGEVQVLAAEALRERQDLGLLPLSSWLSLLQLENPEALFIVAELVKKYVDPKRLTLEQCVALACVRAAPVAELGLEWLRAQTVQSVAGLETVLGLARAEGSVVREQAVAWLVALMKQAAFAGPTHVRALLDARYADVRAAAMALMMGDARYRDETLLWSALSESPYDDVRVVLLKHLVDREALFGPAQLKGLWATTLLAVHRGSRAKTVALRQLGLRLEREAGEREELLHLLAVALRSVRAPERRGALAQVAGLAARVPAVRAMAQTALPELALTGEVIAP